MPAKKFTHTDKHEKACMVDVSHKPDMLREATAEGYIDLHPDTIRLIQNNEMKKGDVLTVARIAGIQAAKQTFSMIPLCHPIRIDKIDVKAEVTPKGVRMTSLARCLGPTGIEMEALTAVAVALLTVYDMCKAVDKNMKMHDIKLVEKTKKAVGGE